MLDAFVRLHDIDILFMKAMTRPFTTGFQGYTIHYNIGTSQRGTAVLTHDTIVVTNLSRIPSGRAIAATLGTLLIIKYICPLRQIQTIGTGGLLQQQPSLPSGISL